MSYRTYADVVKRVILSDNNTSTTFPIHTNPPLNPDVLFKIATLDKTITLSNGKEMSTQLVNNDVICQDSNKTPSSEYKIKDEFVNNSSSPKNNNIAHFGNESNNALVNNHSSSNNFVFLHIQPFK